MQRISYLWKALFMVTFILAACSSPGSEAEISILIPPTSTPTRTAKQTNTLQPTPVPTLSPDEVKDLLENLIETNGGCELPCWWGITPGETTWLQAKELLDPLISMKTEYPDLIIYRFLEVEGIAASHLSARVSKAGDKVSTITISTPIDFADFLSIYGKPDEIWIKAVGFLSPIPFSEYRIAFFYEELGLMPVYEGRSNKNSEISICPLSMYKEFNPLWLWDPSQLMKFEDIANEGLISKEPVFYATFRLIEEISDYDPQKVFEEYKDPENIDCFKVRDPFWPTETP